MKSFCNIFFSFLHWNICFRVVRPVTTLQDCAKKLLCSYENQNRKVSTIFLKFSIIIFYQIRPYVVTLCHECRHTDGVTLTDLNQLLRLHYYAKYAFFMDRNTSLTFRVVSHLKGHVCENVAAFNKRTKPVLAGKYTCL
jgi:hypothetical protein